MRQPVTIVPWLHSINYSTHRDAGYFVRRLPDESNQAGIFLECTPQMIRIAESILTKSSAIINKLPLKKNKFSEDFLSFLHVYFECRKRGFRVFPIETERSRGAELIGTGLPVEMFNATREEFMIKQIQKYVARWPTKKFYVITGAAHVYPLLSRCKKVGIRARISFNGANDAHHAREFKELVALEYKKRRAKEKGEVEKTIIVAQKINHLMMGLRNRLNAPMLEWQLFQQMSTWSRTHNAPRRVRWLPPR